ncbi:helix-turn-helix domain-containing protein [Streptomyces sp. NPDC051286]|uniref:helix-turn-helix domain-containing protein n=1 Tax=Streptomyces sp. NPDC051286 TaxID=3365647 RepID=UPI0037BC1237
MDEKTFGRLLREARQRALFTLERLAEVSGVSVRAISDMERGHSLPRQATLRELMDALGLDEDERRRLVGASTRSARQVPRQLPPDLAVFRGREEALTAVHTITSQVAARCGQVVIAAVGGMAGVGKTTLAVHWAHRVAEHFPDGQLYVNLRGFENSGRPLDPGEALAGFLGALGVPSSDIPRGTEERSALFREQAASRQLIVVLDNARDADQARPLLPAAPGCLTILTSRCRLSALATTEGASLISLDVWTQPEAVAALAARIGADRCRAEPEDAARLVELCGHLPLAIAVVGAQLSAEPRMPLRLAARELAEARLDTLSAGDRRADVRAVFSWSYRALTPDTARFFRYLALHPGAVVSAEAAASLAGAEMTVARRHLGELTSASLLSRDADGRYMLHDLVRAYGTELAEQEQDDRSAAETRLLDYLRHNAHAANHFLDTRRGIEPTEPPAPGAVRVAIGTGSVRRGWTVR